MELTIHVDGGSRGNPGPAGFGVRATDGEGNVVAEHYGFIGVATNNVAEYRGLLHALRLAARLGAENVRICSDSELVVKQMKGEYRVKHADMIPLHREASQLLRGLPEASLRHVRREDNKDADALANRAMDERASRLE
jgi:ribonuclease HI